MSISPISFKGSSPEIDEIDIPRFVDYDYKHLYPRKAPVEQPQRSYAPISSTSRTTNSATRSTTRSSSRPSSGQTSSTTRRSASGDTFEYTPRQRSHQPSKKGKRTKRNSTNKIALLLAAALALGGGTKVAVDGLNASQTQDHDSFDRTPSAYGEASPMHIVVNQPIIYDEESNAVTVNDTYTYDEIIEPVEEIDEKIDEIGETDSLDFDFEINLCPEQEYSVNAFMQHWEENHERYENLAQVTGLPAKAIAIIHWREGAGKFDRYLHDGTKIGEPVQSPLDNGKVFWSFEDSAISVISQKYDGKSVVEDDFYSYLEFAESYNGWGYRNAGYVSPYVWAGTDKYVSGKYIADGSFDPNYTDKQPGVAVLLASIW